jgi:hypothetical protein
MSFAQELAKVLAKKEGSLSIEPSSDDPLEIEAPSAAILLTEENCGACAFAKEALKDDIEAGKITVCDLANEECKQIGREIGLKEVPAMLVPDENGKLTQCEMGKEGDNLAISCPIMPNTEAEEEAPPPRHGKMGKQGISCMDFKLKHILTVEAQNAGVPQEELLRIQSLPTCENASLGFSPIKKEKGAETKSTSDRMAFMRSCLSGSTGEPQPLRMKRCSKDWREMPEEEKRKFK